MHCDMKDYVDEKGNLHFIKVGVWYLSDTLNWMELSFVVEVNSLRNQSYSSSTGQQVSQGKRILGIHCTQMRKHASVTRSPKQRCRWLHKKMFFDSFKKVSPYDLEFLQRYSLFLTYVEDSFTRSRQILFQNLFVSASKLKKMPVSWKSLYFWIKVMRILELSITFHPIYSLWSVLLAHLLQSVY